MKLGVLSSALVLAFAGALLVAADEPAPLWPGELLARAEQASAAAAPLLRRLATPADEFVMNDESHWRVEPGADFLRPGAEGPTQTLRVLGDGGGDVVIAPADVAKARYYESDVLAGVDTLLKADCPLTDAWAAEQLVRAGLRFSLSHRQGRTPGNNPWAGLQTELADRLVEVRRRLLRLLANETELTEALHCADIWLPLYGAESRVGDEVRAVWVRHAGQLLAAGELAKARTQLNRLEQTFGPLGPSEALYKDARGRAETLLQQARTLPDAKALAPLQQAWTLWPRLPELRDTLEKRKATYQVLYVAVRELPELLSPALAFSDAERQTLELIFEGLVHAHHDPQLGIREQPRLAATLGTGSGVRRPLTLRRDAFWSDGEPFTAADVRHTVALLSALRTAESAAWRELIETPRLDSNPYRLQLLYRQGTLDPRLPLRTRLLPQHANGKALTHADDLLFARRPIGTGPYMVHGKESADGRTYLVLRANPQFVRQGVRGPDTVRELRLFAWNDANADPGQPAPHLVLDPLPSQTAALKKAGASEVRQLALARVWFLAVNHRRPALANVQARLALAQALDRRGLLERHFAPGQADGQAHTLNGLFPRGSWANSPVQRVPDELYRPEEARANARRAGNDLNKAEWTLKYPAGDPRLDAAFKDLAEQTTRLLAAAEVHITIRPVPLATRALQAALRDRDFDLLYTHLDEPDTPESLRPLFDPHPQALSAGGSNILGYDQDIALQTLLSSALNHRDFAAVRNFMQEIHARLYATMPLIPLWQLPYPVAVHRKLHAPDLDALAVFGNVLDWKLAP